MPDTAPAHTPLEYRLPAAAGSPKSPADFLGCPAAGSPSAYWHLIRTLRLALPPPPDDGAEALLKRDHAAIAQIAALAPGDAVEAKLAAHFVAASEQWMDCLRLAQQPETTPEAAAKCRAQALNMMREARSALRDLQRMQEARRKLEADNVARNRRERTEHAAARLMAEPLQDLRPASTQRAAPSPADPGLDPGVHSAAASAEPCPPASVAAGTAPQPLTAGANPEPLENPESDPIADAEEYAVMYPERAGLIRRLGGVPDDVSFGPPDADVVQALINARTPVLAALDHPRPETARA